MGISKQRRSGETEEEFQKRVKREKSNASLQARGKQLRKDRAFSPKKLSHNERVAKACEMVKSSEQSGSRKSLNVIATAFNISPSTVSRRLRYVTKEKGADRTSLPGPVEKELRDFIIKCQLAGYPVGRNDIAAIVKVLAKLDNLKVPSNWVSGVYSPSAKWFRSFEARQGLSLRTVHSISAARARAADPISYADHFDRLARAKATHHELLKAHFGDANISESDPRFLSRIINMDETATCFDRDRRKAYGVTGSRDVLRIGPDVKARITSVFTTSPNGHLHPPYFIVPGKDGKFTQAVATAVGRNGISAQEKAWMSQEVFEKWLEFIRSGIEGPLLLLLDNCTSHISIKSLRYCITNNINLVFLPPNATHHLQPNDQMVFATFKRVLPAHILQKHKSHKDYHAALIYAALAAWQDAYTEKTAKASWACTGAFPVNPYAINNSVLQISSSEIHEPSNGIPLHWYDKIQQARTETAIQQHQAVVAAAGVSEEVPIMKEPIDSHDTDLQEIDLLNISSLPVTSIDDSAVSVGDALAPSASTPSASTPSASTPSDSVLIHMSLLPSSSPSPAQVHLHSQAYIQYLEKLVAEKDAVIAELSPLARKNLLTPPQPQQSKSQRRTRVTGATGDEALEALNAAMQKKKEEEEKKKRQKENGRKKKKGSKEKENTNPADNSDEDAPLIRPRGNKMPLLDITNINHPSASQQ